MEVEAVQKLTNRLRQFRPDAQQVGVILLDRLLPISISGIHGHAVEVLQSLKALLGEILHGCLLAARRLDVS